ncbi:MAG: carbon-nitrogen hydrolase family protein [Anaerolineae bacterium]|jgi:predicted amidohydrolase|nr:carbon-nitrogen hydrolase family protein [Anaerolineae bacterium]
MSRTVTAAAVRLSNVPAPTHERLQNAAIQIAEAAAQGAELVVLPELFNTGYVYSRENYTRAEPIDGPTVTWMKAQAAEHSVHLAGSLLLLGPEHITNSLFLAAPDGRWWRYDKNFPWAWERLYFREGREITVAKTDIGTFGLMICADVFVPHLFGRYAGKVDALIVCASPPQMHKLEFRFPDGWQTTLADLLAVPEATRAAADEAFGAHELRYTTWLGVPVVQSIPWGQFSSHIPIPWLSFGIPLAHQPALWRYIPQGREAIGTANYYPFNQIADAEGNVLVRYDKEADGFALATIKLADTPPTPRGRPPRSQILSPDIANWIMIPFYRLGVRRAWGRHMARPSYQTRAWIRTVFRFTFAAYFVGRLHGTCRRWRRQRRKNG